MISRDSYRDDYVMIPGFRFSPFSMLGCPYLCFFNTVLCFLVGAFENFLLVPEGPQSL